MATTAIFGINSNLDTGGIIDNLVALQRSPIDIVEAKRSLEDAKLLSFQDLKGRLQTFKSIAKACEKWREARRHSTTTAVVATEKKFKVNRFIQQNIDFLFFV